MIQIVGGNRQTESLLEAFVQLRYFYSGDCPFTINPYLAMLNNERRIICYISSIVAIRDIQIGLLNSRLSLF